MLGVLGVLGGGLRFRDGVALAVLVVGLVVVVVLTLGVAVLVVVVGVEAVVVLLLGIGLAPLAVAFLGGERGLRTLLVLAIASVVSVAGATASLEDTLTGGGGGDGEGDLATAAVVCLAVAVGLGVRAERSFAGGGGEGDGGGGCGEGGGDLRGRAFGGGDLGGRGEGDGEIMRGGGEAACAVSASLAVRWVDTTTLPSREAKEVPPLLLAGAAAAFFGGGGLGEGVLRVAALACRQRVLSALQGACRWIGLDACVKHLHQVPTSSVRLIMVAPETVVDAAL